MYAGTGGTGFFCALPFFPFFVAAAAAAAAFEALLWMAAFSCVRGRRSPHAQLVGMRGEEGCACTRSRSCRRRLIRWSRYQ